MTKLDGTITIWKQIEEELNLENHYQNYSLMKKWMYRILLVLMPIITLVIMGFVGSYIENDFNKITQTYGEELSGLHKPEWHYKLYMAVLLILSIINMLIIFLYYIKSKSKWKLLISVLFLSFVCIEFVIIKMIYSFP